jgi:hypothetical protein
MGEVTAFWWKLMLAGAEQRGQTTREFLRPKKKDGRGRPEIHKEIIS